MKKIYIFAMLVFSVSAHGATTSLGKAIAANSSAPQYLVQAADAWDSLIGTPMRGGAIATRMSAMNEANNNGRLYDVMSVLAFNNTAMTIYQTSRHLDEAYDVISNPLLSRRSDSMRNFVINAHGIGATDKFEHHKNDDFEMRTGGAGVSAYAYVTNGLTFGVGYTYAKSKSHDMPLDAEGSSNIVSLFSKYLGESGWYINTALAAGQTRWELDKTLAGVADKTPFDTDIYSGQVTTGIALNRGRVSLAPEIGVRYTRLSNEKHVDAAAQDFKKWWYNTLSADAGASVGVTFAAGGLLIRPTVKFGAGYDIIHNGTDKVATRLITGHSYDMPVHAPNRTELRGGGGIGLYGSKIAAEATYTLHSRSDYTAHEVQASVKVAF
ncbi:MAG: autotransporter outer membrane beta-barrel domain-containing protein [Alphaproteobacteria bacterium]|nr:autotransporter outer membrane beta-barrel domain-containing protein [Alphaproteobacteria bacterium]